MYIIIVGCGRVGSELAKLLSRESYNVVVIDKDPASFDRLGKTFNGVTLAGNGFDKELLKSAGIEKADAVCAVSDNDNANLIVSQVAKTIFNVPKVITRVYDQSKASIYRGHDLEIINGTLLVAAMMRDKLVESQFSDYLIESGDVGVLEITAEKDMVGKLVSELNVTGELIISTVIRRSEAVIPGPQERIQKQDVLVAVVKTAHLAAVKKRFNL